MNIDGSILRKIYAKGYVQKKTVYLKTLTKQVGGWSRPFQNFLNEFIFDIR